MHSNYKEIKQFLDAHNATLVAVSKTKPVSEILEIYNSGQRDFGENRVQELTEKAEQLPKDIRWHQIGHLQKNKIKYIAPFIYLIHSVDSLELLIEINKQAQKHNRIISCLLQIFIAKEESKFGLDEKELYALLNSTEYKELNNIKITGLMGMATFSDDTDLVKNEFRHLKKLFDSIKTEFFNNDFNTLSMGMSSDYILAIEEGTTMVRIGSLIFGDRK